MASPHLGPGPSRLLDDLRRVGLESGLDAVGVAPATPFEQTRAQLVERRSAGLHGGMSFTYRDPDRATDPSRALPGARSLVVGARSYRRRSPASRPQPAGRVASYSWTDQYTPLRRALQAVADHLMVHGWRTRVMVDDNGLVDKEAAHRAGLGWYGKNTLLLLPGRGSWFVLGSVVTDAPLRSAGTLVRDGCGSCSRCVRSCPTGALSDGVLDARRCLAWLLEAPGWFPREHREALGDRLYGCDDCQGSCPVNRHGDARRPAPEAEEGAEALVDVVELLGSDDSELMGRFGRWYVPRRQPRYLRRNALVVLGNVGDGTSPRVEEVLRRCLASPDPLVRGHAVWAARRLGRTDLLASLDREVDPKVREELSEALGAGESR